MEENNSMKKIYISDLEKVEGTNFRGKGEINVCKKKFQSFWKKNNIEKNIFQVKNIRILCGEETIPKKKIQINILYKISVDIKFYSREFLVYIFMAKQFYGKNFQLNTFVKKFYILFYFSD